MMELLLDEKLSQFKYLKGRKCLEKSYVYEEQIGKGAYGYVICGYRRNDRLSVAIKIIPDNKIENWQFSNRLQKLIPTEIILLAYCKQVEGVIVMQEFGQDESLHEWYIIMARNSETVDLFDFICNCSPGYLEEDIARSIFYQLTRIIVDLHRLGVLHRDIKEENILINTRTHEIWLIDFGSAILMESDGYLDKFNGTLAYSPPEWIKYRRYNGCSLESWSLGIILYVMLCGSVPYEDEEEIIKQTCSTPCISSICPLKERHLSAPAFTNHVHFPRRDLSQSSRNLINNCLNPDPEARIRPIEILKSKWLSKPGEQNVGSVDSGRGSFDDASQEEKAEIGRHIHDKGVITDFSRCMCSCLNGQKPSRQKPSNEASTKPTQKSNKEEREGIPIQKKISNASRFSTSNSSAIIEEIPYNEAALRDLDQDLIFGIISKSMSPYKISRRKLFMANHDTRFNSSPYLFHLTTTNNNDNDADGDDDDEMSLVRFTVDSDNSEDEYFQFEMEGI